MSDRPPASKARPSISAGFGWLAFSQYSNRLLGVISTLLLAKLLSPADFGLAALAMTVVEVVQLLKDMGVSEAVIFSRREDTEAIDTAHTVLVGYNVLLFLALSGAAPFVAAAYDAPVLTPVIILMASTLVMNAMRSVPLALIRKNLGYRELVIPELVSTSVASVLAIALAWFGWGVWSLVAKTVVQGLLALAILNRIIPYKPRFGFNREAAAELFAYGRFVVGASVLLVMLYNIDKFYISRVAGIAIFGAFELALRIAELPARQLGALVGAVMFPVFSRMNNDRDALRAIFLRTLRYTASVVIPGTICLATFGPAVATIVYGTKWSGLADVMPALAIYAAIRSLSSISHDLLKATGHPQRLQQATLAKLLVIGGAGIPVVQQFSATGMAVLMVVTWAVGLGWELRQVSGVLELSVSTPLRLILTPLLLSLLTFPVAAWLYGRLSATPSLLGIAAIALASLGVFALGLGRIDAEIGERLRMLAGRLTRRLSPAGA